MTNFLEYDIMKIDNMELIQSLKNLGLNEKEAKVYVALLQTGKATAYSVAKHSGLKKPTTYVILEDLIDKGIVNKVPRTKTMQYAAISPGDLFSIYKSRLENAEKEALPELKALSRGKEYKVRASYFEGMGGIKELYRRMFKAMAGKEVVGFYAHQKDTSLELQQCWQELNEEIRKKYISRRAITTRHPSLGHYIKKETQKKYHVKLKALPEKKYNSNISVEMYKNFTQIISHRHLQGILIDNPDIAKVMKQIFELVWEREDIEVKDKAGQKTVQPPKGKNRLA